MSKIASYFYRSGYLKDVFLIPSDNSKTALSLTVGFYLAIFPVPGTVTLLGIIVSFLFRLNLVLLQGMNWLFFPLQLALLYPFLKTGRLLIFEDTKILSLVWPENLWEAITRETFFQVLELMAGGILVWGLLCLATGYFLFRLLLRITIIISQWQ